MQVPEINAKTPVTNGSGVFIARNKKSTVSEETHKKAYAIFHKYSLANSPENFSNRENLILKEIKAIDPNLEITFIPRTLYELAMIKMFIDEDVKNGKSCEGLEVNQRAVNGFEKKCLHSYIARDPGNDLANEVIDLAFKMNNYFVHQLKKHKGMLTFAQIEKFTKKEIDGLITYSNSFDKNWDRSKINLGPAVYFGLKKQLSEERPNMAIEKEDKTLITNVLKFDCSEEARENVFIYRGGDFSKNNIVTPKGHAHVFSFGTSLFAGAVYDPGACVYKYSKAGKDCGGYFNDTFAIKIPVKEISDSCFQIPLTHPICQLLGHGETFHARNKLWMEATPNDGHFCMAMDYDYLRMDTNKKSLQNRVQFYFQNYSYMLRSASIN